MALTYILYCIAGLNETVEVTDDFQITKVAYAQMFPKYVTDQ